MEYRLVETDAVPTAEGRSCRPRQLSGPAGRSQVAIDRFTAEAGEQLPLAYHYHDEREEAFGVLSGTLAVGAPPVAGDAVVYGPESDG